MRYAAAAFLAVAASGLLALSLVVPSDSEPSTPRVYAASSLRDVLLILGDTSRFSFAGSDLLQRQIEQGAPADVFVSASPREPAALHAAGLCTAPRPFASNRLAVLVARAGSPAVRSARQLGRPGLRLAMGTPGVPVGRAAREALGRLGVDLSRAVVSSEPDARSVVAKVALGSADAAVGYVTDAGDRVRAIPLPDAARAEVEYHVCAVRREAADREGAARFIDRLTGPAGRSALNAAGFGPPL